MTDKLAAIRAAAEKCKLPHGPDCDDGMGRCTYCANVEELHDLLDPATVLQMVAVCEAAVAWNHTWEDNERLAAIDALRAACAPFEGQA